ncbi:hypothetical protein F4X88_15985, partial [Candidatus Poribacteria bacterium]|nr:hypothetical protein [Candidatus Poribacteria bacterium]
MTRPLVWVSAAVLVFAHKDRKCFGLSVLGAFDEPRLIEVGGGGIDVCQLCFSEKKRESPEQTHTDSQTRQQKTDAFVAGVGENLCPGEARKRQELRDPRNR